MQTQKTRGIEITVECQFQHEMSNPQNGEFLFSYRIVIENKNEFAVQLLRRHWDIFDSIGEHRQVDGDGVIGMQPIIPAGGMFEYMSGCNLKSEMGKMWGHYQMLNKNSHREFTVTIPEFALITPMKWN